MKTVRCGARGGVGLALVLTLMVGYGCEGEAVTETEIRQRIGAEGGEILGPKGSRLVVPVGALQEECTLVLRERTEEDLAGLTDGTLISERLSPAIEVIAESPETAPVAPLTLEMLYDPTGISYEEQEEQLRVFYTTRWPLPPPGWIAQEAIIDPHRHWTSVELGRWGTYALFRLDPSSALLDPAAIPDGDESEGETPPSEDVEE